MYAVMQSIFGTYTPVTTGYYDATGAYVADVVANGVAGVDWTYVGGVFLFAVVLYCSLRIIEAVIRSL